MIVNVPLNAIGEDLASLPGPNIPSLVYCVREGAEIKFCAFCTRQIVVSPTSPPLLSASLSRALTTVLLCLLPSCRCLPAIKRGRDNAGVEEISPRFHPRHRFEGSSCLVISMDFFLFFLFSSRNEFASANFFSRRVDKNFAKPSNERISPPSNFSLSANARISADG